MQNKNFLLIIIVILVFGGVFLFTRKDQDVVDEVVKVEPAPVVELNGVDQTIPTGEDTVVDDGKEVEEEVTENSEEVNSEVKTFEIGGGSFYLTPNEITVTKGDTVRIVFTNEGGTHNWSIDEFNAETDFIQTGETTEVTFEADRVGTFEFYCGVGNHRELGMVGALIVEPSAE